MIINTNKQNDNIQPQLYFQFQPQTKNQPQTQTQPQTQAQEQPDINNRIINAGKNLPYTVMLLMQKEGYENTTLYLNHIANKISPKSLELCKNVEFEIQRLIEYEKEFDRLDKMGIFTINEIRQKLE